jgi:hypothetical protein
MKPLGCLWRVALVLVVGFLALAILAPDRERSEGGALPTLASLATSTPQGENANELYAATQTAAAVALPTRAGNAPATPPDRPTASGAEGAALPPLNVPALSLDDAQANADANPDDPAAYLALFRAQLEAGQTDALTATLEAGVGVAENAAQFLLTAAQIADEAGNRAIGVVILRDGLSRLTNDSSYLMLRSEAGAILYGAALTPESVDLFELRDAIDISTLNRGDISPIYTVMAARALLTHGNLRLAGLAIEVALRRDSQMPEGRLVEGEIASARGDDAEARRIWEDLQSKQQMPPWVRERLAELLGA